MSTKKTTHNITKPAQPAKKPYVYEEYYDLNSWRMKPVNESWIEQLATELRDWADKDTSFKLFQFVRSRKIACKDYYRWLTKFRALEEAHEYALGVIGDRREIGAIKKEYDSGMVKFSMPKYDKDWADLVKFYGENKNQEEAAIGIRVVEIEKIPTTDIVPEKDKPKKTPEEVAAKIRRQSGGRHIRIK